ncbi:MAG: hypothetical protein HY286_02130 [Planctomycetes bacterium]|nr:hypothetical protein [Planctomycetota bacterium]
MFTNRIVHSNFSGGFLVSLLLFGATIIQGPAPATSHAPQSGPAASAAAAAKTVTIAFQPGDGNAPYSNNCDWRLMEDYPDFTSTLWTGSVLVGHDNAAPGGEHRWLINFPNIIGNHQGQIPPNVHITDATLQVLANHAAHVPIEARAVLESNMGQAGYVAGQDASESPKWFLRMPGAAWTTPGAGWPGSSSLAPDDSKTVDVDYAWLSLNITKSVQSWAADPVHNNCGMLLSTPALGSAGQEFAGGNADPTLRPILTVTYEIEKDVAPPFIIITSTPDSPVKRAYVEGRVGVDVVQIHYQTGDGIWHEAQRIDAERWSAWVDLRDKSVTNFEVAALDKAGNSASAHTPLHFAPTDLTNTKSLLLAASETILVHYAPGHVQAINIQIDPGDGRPAVSVPFGADATIPFPSAGSFILKAGAFDAFGTSVANVTVPVVVASFGVNRAVACQTGHTREMDFTLVPPGALSNIYIESKDGSELLVQHVHEDSGSIVAKLTPLKANTPTVVARLGGESGRPFAEIPVYTFLQTHTGVQILNIMPDQKELVQFGFHELPAPILLTAPHLQFHIKLFSDASTFTNDLVPGGGKELDVTASSFDASGTFTATAIFDPTAAAECCRSITAFDTAAPAFINPQISADTSQNVPSYTFSMSGGTISDGKLYCLGVVGTDIYKPENVGTGTWSCKDSSGAQVAGCPITDPVTGCILPTFIPSTAPLGIGDHTIDIEWNAPDPAPCTPSDSDKKVTGTFHYTIVKVGKVTASAAGVDPVVSIPGQAAPTMVVPAGTVVSLLAEPEGGPSFPDHAPTWTDEATKFFPNDDGGSGRTSAGTAANPGVDYIASAENCGDGASVHIKAVDVHKMNVTAGNYSGTATDTAPLDLVACAVGQTIKAKAIPNGNDTFPTGKPTWSVSGPGATGDTDSANDTYTFVATVPGTYTISSTCVTTVTAVLHIVKMDKLTATWNPAPPVVVDQDGGTGFLRVPTADQVHLKLTSLGGNLPPGEPTWTLTTPAGSAVAAPAAGTMEFDSKPDVDGDYNYTCKTGDNATRSVTIRGVSLIQLHITQGGDGGAHMDVPDPGGNIIMKVCAGMPIVVKAIGSDGDNFPLQNPKVHFPPNDPCIMTSGGDGDTVVQLEWTCPLDPDVDSTALPFMLLTEDCGNGVLAVGFQMIRILEQTDNNAPLKPKNRMCSNVENGDVRDVHYMVTLPTGVDSATIHVLAGPPGTVLDGPGGPTLNLIDVHDGDNVTLVSAEFGAPGPWAVGAELPGLGIPSKEFCGGTDNEIIFAFKLVIDTYVTFPSTSEPAPGTGKAESIFEDAPFAGPKLTVETTPLGDTGGVDQPISARMATIEELEVHTTPPGSFDGVVNPPDFRVRTLMQETGKLQDQVTGDITTGNVDVPFDPFLLSTNFDYKNVGCFYRFKAILIVSGFLFDYPGLLDGAEMVSSDENFIGEKIFEGDPTNNPPIPPALPSAGNLEITVIFGDPGMFHPYILTDFLFGKPSFNVGPNPSSVDIFLGLAVMAYKFSAEEAIVNAKLKGTPLFLEIGDDPHFKF